MRPQGGLHRRCPGPGLLPGRRHQPRGHHDHHGHRGRASARKDAMLDAGPARAGATAGPAPDVRSRRSEAAECRRDATSTGWPATLEPSGPGNRLPPGGTDRVQLLVAAAEEAIANAAANWMIPSKQQFDAQRELIAAQTELDELRTRPRGPGKHLSTRGRHRALADADGQDGLRQGTALPARRRPLDLRSLG